MTNFQDPKEQRGERGRIIIPERFIELGLNDLFLMHHGPSRDPEAQNPFLDPIECALAMKNFHIQQGALWSYGGYLEKRADFLRGSEDAIAERVVHLGLDVNVPFDTTVVLPKPVTIVEVVEKDTRLGPHLLFEQEDWPGYLGLLAHLGDIKVRSGQQVPAGDIIGRVGRPPYNGNQHPHLHIQRIDKGHYEVMSSISSDFELREYEAEQSSTQLAGLYPDPIDLVNFDHFSRSLAAA